MVSPVRESFAPTGCGPAWLGRRSGGPEVGSSNLPNPTAQKRQGNDFATAAPSVSFPLEAAANSEQSGFAQAVSSSSLLAPASELLCAPVARNARRAILGSVGLF